MYKFKAVVEEGGITIAAKRLRISQPALSSALKKLERELKADLIQVKGRKIYITKAGKLTYNYAKDLSRTIDDLRHDLAVLDNQKPQISLGMIDSMADVFTIRGDVFASLDRLASISLVVHNSKQLKEMTHQVKLKCALVVSGEHSGDLMSQSLGNEPLVAVCSADITQDIKDKILNSQEIPFIAYNAGSSTFKLISDHLDKSSVDFKPVFYSTSPELMRRLAFAARGVAILPYILVQDDIRQNKLEVINEKPFRSISRPISCIGFKADFKSPIVKKVCDQSRVLLSSLKNEVEEFYYNCG